MDKRMTLLIIISIVSMTLSLLYLKLSGDCCLKDSDCAVYPGRLEEEPCCWDCGYMALTKKQYEERLGWEAENCAEFNQSDCVRCKAAPENEFEAVCSAGVCRVVGQK